VARPHEFSAKTKQQAAERAKGHCERCTAPLREGHYRYDHDIPIALGGESTLENCVVACKNCDDTKTYQHDLPRIAKAERNSRKSHGIKKRSRFPGSRDSPWRKKISGKIVPR
jgi:5-methylcytosine-specific restriction endonuclease McrA